MKKIVVSLVVIAGVITICFGVHRIYVSMEYKMTEGSYWFFSTVAQTTGAIIGLIGAILGGRIFEHLKETSVQKAKIKELEKQNNYIQKIHAEIDNLNLDIPEKLKIGMTRNQIKNILGENNIHSIYNGYTAGRYFLIFQGDVLVKIVANGSRLKYGHIIYNIF